MKSFLLIVISVFFLSATGSYALEASMKIRPAKITINSSAICEVEIKGLSTPPRPSFPAIPGLTIRPIGQSSSTSFINGALVRKTTYRYGITPHRTGTFTIGPFDYTAKKDTVPLNAVTFKVVPISQQFKGSAQKADQDTPSEDLNDYITGLMSSSQTNVIVNEVFDLNIYIYYRNLKLSQQAELINLPTKGLKIDQFRELASKDEVIEGVEYSVRRWRAKARALSEGEYILAPTIRTHIVIPSERRSRRFDPFNDFFSRQNTRPFDVQLKAANIMVSSPPEKGRPSSYHGAVGDLRFRVSINPSQLNEGDPITLSMEVSGQGNMDIVRAPEIKASTDFKVYKNKLLKSELNDTETGGRKLYEQVIIPKNAKITEIPALEFSYYDMNKRGYKTLVQGPFPVKITASTNQLARVVENGGTAQNTGTKILGEDIVYLKSVPAVWGNNDPAQLLSKTSFWSLQSIPLALLALSYFIFRRNKELVENTGKARRLKAPKAAKEALLKTKASAQQDDHKAFYEAGWHVLESYFGNRFNLAAGDINEQNIEAALIKRNADEELKAISREWFRKAEQSRFGTSPVDVNLTEELTHLETMLKQCEKLK